MAEGYIKWYSESKGYGFIATEEDDEDIFVHRSGFPEYGNFDLIPDLKVTFDMEDTPKGKKAVNVRPL